MLNSILSLKRITRYVNIKYCDVKYYLCVAGLMSMYESLARYRIHLG